MSKNNSREVDEFFNATNPESTRKRNIIDTVFITYSIIFALCSIYLVYYSYPIFMAAYRYKQLPPLSYYLTVAIYMVVAGAVYFIIRYYQNKSAENDPLCMTYYLKKYSQLYSGERKAWFKLLSDPTLPEQDGKYIQIFYEAFQGAMK